MRWKRGNRLPIREEQASPRTREILDELCHSLGVPAVPVLYRVYAAFPEFLEVHWTAFRPALQSRQFFTLGARLAAESYTRAHNYFPIQALTPCESQPGLAPPLPIAQVLDYYQYLDPLLLLIAAAQMQALEGPVGQNETPEPANHPVFPISPCLLADSQSTATVHRIWEERRRILDLAFISDEHRALACWPDLYREYWAGLKKLLQSPLYADCQYRIGESAWSMTHELPARLETGVSQLLEAGMHDEEVSSLARINEAFLQAMTGLLLDITFARIGCDGGTHGQTTAAKQEPARTPKKKKNHSRTRAA